MSAPKRLKELVDLALAANWTYDETEDGHPRLTPPAGTTDPHRNGRLAAPVVFSKTPSDHRGDLNQISMLRRLGLDLPHKGHTQKKGK